MKYVGNFVILNLGKKDFCDLKVFWYEKENKWVMVLVVGD